MASVSFAQRLGQWLLVAFLFGSGLAFAQAEPTMNQIYATAQAGKLAEAQVMVQQVLISHPNSAKAHFVRAELYARQGDAVRARDSLANAERLAPGLPFAKPEAVQALRTQLASQSAARPVANPAVAHASSVPAETGTSWVLPLLLAGGVILAGYFLFRRKMPDPGAQLPGYSNNGLNGPQSFGSSAGGAMPGPYPGYPPAAAPGMGSRIMGGVATGLAVGAGVMAAEAIGRNLMGGHNANAATVDNTATGTGYQGNSGNADMGGANFGVNDSSSWDDAGGADFGGGGGDWDN